MRCQSSPGEVTRKPLTSWFIDGCGCSQKLAFSNCARTAARRRESLPTSRKVNEKRSSSPEAMRSLCGRDTTSGLVPNTSSAVCASRPTTQPVR
jgi:hypothetical protein